MVILYPNKLGIKENTLIFIRKENIYSHTPETYTIHTQASINLLNPFLPNTYYVSGTTLGTVNTEVKRAYPGKIYDLFCPGR